MSARPTEGQREVTLEEKVAFLRRPESYPSPAGNVVARETHMSWVFMVGDRVYKLKKPVRFPYLDFSSLERRAAACRAELALNRRLAPDVYLDVVPLTVSAESLAIGGDGPVADWLVVMRRLDGHGTLEAALVAGRALPSELDRVAATLRAFYRQAQPVHETPEAHLETWRQALALDRRVLLDPRLALPRGLVERPARALALFLERRAGLLAERVRAGRIVDAHGDLRPEHIWLGEPITIIDCLEFDPGLRALDPLDEVAFLHLECTRLGAAWAGDRIREQLKDLLDDDPSTGLFQFYRCHRAMLRARLAIAHLLDPEPRTPERWPALARVYLRLAALDAQRLERLLRTPRVP